MLSALARIRDWLFGRAIRWIGREWAAGKDQAGREQRLHSDLLAALAAVTAELPSLGMGMGSMIEADPKRRMAQAEGQISSLAAQIEDDETARLALLVVEQSRRWTVKGAGPADRQSLVAATDNVRERLRQIRSK